MKKVLCIFFVALLLTGGGYVMAVEDGDISIGHISFFADADCTTQIYKVQPGDIYLRYSLTNTTETQINDIAVNLAAYKNGNLIGIDVVVKPLAKIRNLFFTAKVTLPDDIEGCLVRAFVWETLANVKPVFSVKDLTEESLANDITSLEIDGCTGTINTFTNNINVEMPHYTDVSALTPVIQVSEDADYSPKGAQDFTAPVTYTVTAENGDTQEYTVTIKTGSFKIDENFEGLDVGDFPQAGKGITWSRGPSTVTDDNYAKIADDPETDGTRGRVLHLYDNTDTTTTSSTIKLAAPMDGDVVFSVDVMFNRMPGDYSSEGATGNNVNYNWVFLSAGTSITNDNAVATIGTNSDTGGDTVKIQMDTSTGSQTSSSLFFDIGKWHTIKIIYYTAAGYVSYFIDDELIASLPRKTKNDTDGLVNGIGFMTTPGRTSQIHVDNIKLEPYVSEGVLVDYENDTVGQTPSVGSVSESGGTVRVIEEADGNRALLLDDTSLNISGTQTVTGKSVSTTIPLEKIQKPFEFSLRIKYEEGTYVPAEGETIPADGNLTNYAWASIRGQGNTVASRFCVAWNSGGYYTWRQTYNGGSDREFLSGSSVANMGQWYNVRVIVHEDDTVSYFIDDRLINRATVNYSVNHADNFIISTAALRAQKVYLDDIMLKSYTKQTEFVETFEDERSVNNHWLIAGAPANGNVTIVPDGVDNNVLRIEDSAGGDPGGLVAIARTFDAFDGSFELSYRYKTERGAYEKDLEDVGFCWIGLSASGAHYNTSGTTLASISAVDSESNGLTWGYRIDSAGASAQMNGPATQLGEWHTFKFVYHLDKTNSSNYTLDFYMDDVLIANGVRLNNAIPDRFSLFTTAKRKCVIYIDDLVIKAIDD